MAACNANGTYCMGFNREWTGETICRNDGRNLVIQYAHSFSSGYVANVVLCVCAAGNCWMKGSLDRLSPTGLTDLFVKQNPAGQFQLRSNPSLCLSAGTPLTLANCDATQQSQLFTIEVSQTDGSYVCGPISNVANRQVVDITAQNSAIDVAIGLYQYYGTPNQIFNWDNSTGLIRRVRSVVVVACGIINLFFRVTHN